MVGGGRRNRWHKHKDHVRDGSIIWELRSMCHHSDRHLTSRFYISIGHFRHGVDIHFGRPIANCCKNCLKVIKDV